jgi:putative oxidoreductase
MLNIFPIQFLAPFAYMLLRIVLGLVLLYLGTSHIRNRHSLKEVLSFPFFPYGLFMTWYLGSVEMLIGIMLFVGLFTQIAALLGMALSLKFIVMHKHFSHPLMPSRLCFLFMFMISFTLFITGAGPFAFDLPI